MRLQMKRTGELAGVSRTWVRVEDRATVRVEARAGTIAGLISLRLPGSWGSPRQSSWKLWANRDKDLLILPPPLRRSASPKLNSLMRWAFRGVAGRREGASRRLGGRSCRRQLTNLPSRMARAVHMPVRPVSLTLFSRRRCTDAAMSVTSRATTESPPDGAESPSSRDRSRRSA